MRGFQHIGCHLCRKIVLLLLFQYGCLLFLSFFLWPSCSGWDFQYNTELLLFSPQVMPDSVTQWTAAHQASLSFTISHSLLRTMSPESAMRSNHLILCRLLLWPSTFPSIKVFSSELVLHIRWPKYSSFSFSISPSSEYLGLISFVIDWLDLLAVKGTLKNFL